MFDFGALPPEINSGRIYTGPGAGPLMAAGTAWDELAAELGTAASGYSSVISELTNGLWAGPTSSSMVAAVLPYVSWLSAASALSEQTASQARAAAAAFEAAFAMTVPPPEIAANRALLMALIATNFFGQNTPAIAATEAQYMQMWAQDAVAMYGYAGASTAAGQLTPFSSPPNTTTPDAVTQQAMAVSQANALQAGTTAQNTATTAPHLATATAMPQTLKQLSTTTPLTTTGQGTSSSLIPSPTNWWGLDPTSYKIIFHDLLQVYNAYGTGYHGFNWGQALTSGPGGTTAGMGGAWYPTPQFAHLGLGNLGGGGGISTTASVGQAGRVGMLSVPQSWAATPVSDVTPVIAGGETPSIHATANASPANGLLRGMPVGSAARRSTAGYVNKYGFRYSVLTRPPSAG